MTDSLRFEMMMKKAGYSRKDIAKFLNITYSGLCKKLKNETEFKASEIMIILEKLELSLSDRDAIFFAQ